MKRLRRWSAGLGVACLLLAVPSFSFAQAAAATAKDAMKDAAKKAGGKVAPTSPIDLNSASQAELESVPGIGAATAKKIISGRPFSSVADLSKIGVDAKRIQTLAPMLKVGSMAASTTAAMPKPVAPAMPVPAPMAKAATAAAATTATTAASKAVTSAAGTGTCAPSDVWVNTETKVFHRQGDKYFNNTKHGKCMSEADAVKMGAHETKQKTK